jgi:hypothetical protein
MITFFVWFLMRGEGGIGRGRAAGGREEREGGRINYSILAKIKVTASSLYL